jgi:cysteine desulfurase/selenocysteine lyase
MHSNLKSPPPSIRPFDPRAVRAQFPILQTKAYGKPLMYLDNGATTQKPQCVIDVEQQYYASQNANIHRGVYQLSQTATRAYDEARQKIARFINAADPREVIFTRGTTESINLVAHSYARAFLDEGDEIVISALEHHSNIVPWQIACQMTGATLRVISMNDAGELQLDEFAKLLSARTRIVAVTHLSNSLGTIVDVKKIIGMAHDVGAKVLVDGAQWVAHLPTDVQDLDADFYVFSGHKIFGPTGIGVLYGKLDLLEEMPPYQGGGDMIESVTFEKTTYAGLPNKFEAGTPNIAGAIGLGAAIDWLSEFDLNAVAKHEHDLLVYATEKLSQVPGLKVVGTAKDKGSLISFIIEGLSSLDIGTRLDADGIAVRTGHHCCQPVMDRFGIPSTTRASFALYNTREDVDALVESLSRIARTARSEPLVASQSGALDYPDRAAASPDESAKILEENFELLGDWESRYSYILDLGSKLLPLPDVFRTEANRVKGCQSIVYLTLRKRPETIDGVDFLADSDADIVRGLIAILQHLFAGQSANQILAFDIAGFFRRIELDRNLAMTRRNGLAGMVERIRHFASQVSAGSIHGP